MKLHLLTAGSLLCMLIVSGCSSTQKSKKEITSSGMSSNAQAVPAAQGTVTTSKDKNGNTQLLVMVRHLAQPSVLSEGASGYVVWVQPEGTNAYQNIGTLKVNENLEGTYQTKVPYKNFHLIITPESSLTTQSPSGVRVMEKSVNI